jgi:hypothetical protein
LRLRPYMWYAEGAKIRHDAVDWSFCDAIKSCDPSRSGDYNQIPVNMQRMCFRRAAILQDYRPEFFYWARAP